MATLLFWEQNSLQTIGLFFDFGFGQGNKFSLLEFIVAQYHAGSFWIARQFRRASSTFTCKPLPSISSTLLFE